MAGDPTIPTQANQPPTGDMVADDYVVPTGDIDPLREREEAVAKAFFKAFAQSREFDKNIRFQIAKDRQYASGMAQIQWAVSTNLIGSIIDILVAVLYARDPDVSVRKTPQTDSSPDPATGIQPVTQSQRDAELTARTLELVVSKLWKRAGMKKRMRRVLRSVLSVGQGWLKVLPILNTEPDPIAQAQYSSLKDNIAQFDAIRKALAEGQTLEGVTASIEQTQVMQQQLEMQASALAERLETTVFAGFTVDVVKPEDMQIGTDVELLEDHVDSDSNCQLIYIPVAELRAMFPDLKPDDLKTVQNFYKTVPRNANAGVGQNDAADFETVLYPTNAEGEQYGTENPTEGAVPFARVIEQWCRKDNHVHTYIQGVKVPVKPPYQPRWASSRFYPFFYFSIYEVDGSRAPQSLSSRLAKLQDEYATTRSNFRLSRERSITGFYFDGGKFDDVEAKKLKDGLREEMVALRSSDPTVDFSKLFVPKPVSRIDPRLYETQPIIMDMERIAGVQEAQQSAISVEKTATEAEIQQAGFSARTTAARDMIETTLSDLALYTAEIALQTISPQEAQRIAGPFAFWPSGLSIEDIVTLVEVEIAAGTTGKPRNRGDREAWATVMPLIKEVQAQIAELQMTPVGAPLANALKELVKETMLRMGDDTDVERFLPQMPAIPMMPPTPMGGGAPVSGADVMGGAPGPMPGEELPPPTPGAVQEFAPPGV